MTVHPSQERFVEYVVFGATDPELEAHVTGCDGCAARLAEEARVEVACHEVGDAAPSAVARFARTAIPLLAAAVILLGLIGGLRALAHDADAAARVMPADDEQHEPLVLADSGQWSGSADAGVH